MSMARRRVISEYPPQISLDLWSRPCLSPRNLLHLLIWESRSRASAVQRRALPTMDAAPRTWSLQHHSLRKRSLDWLAWTLIPLLRARCNSRRKRCTFSYLRQGNNEPNLGPKNGSMSTYHHERGHRHLFHTPTCYQS